MSSKYFKITVGSTDNDIDKVYALMANVIDGHNGENLYAYLSRFNHLNVGYVADRIAAREAVPEIMRKTGMMLTYYINNKPITEIFIGNKNEAGNWTSWNDDSNWEFHDGIGHVESNSITLNQLSKEVLDLISANNEVNIVNYPDGEDLTQYDVCGGNGKNAINVLKLADKDYNPANFSGYGRIYLRKNLIDGNNILEQSMLNNENTIYISQYDYDLNGETIEVPNNSILVVYGKLLNGTLKCNNTIIVVYNKELIKATVTGSFVYFGYNDAEINIINNLTTDDPDSALSAAQGVILKGLIDNLDNNITQLQKDIENIEIETPTTKPDSPYLGQLWFDTTEKVLKYWNGTTWITINEIEGGSTTDLTANVTKVESLDSEQQATATATIIDNQIQFTFGIPKGEKGDTGIQGEKGDQGEKGEKGEKGDQGAPGQDGKDGVSPTLPNYSIYRYCKSDSKPNAPVGTSQNPSGWLDLPNDTGNWWQCVGEVNGATGAVTQWGEVLPLNGRDGTAQDGKYTEMRFAVNNSRTNYPSINRTTRTPTGWTLSSPTINDGQYLWMTTAIINPNDTLYSNWNIPVCISGPQGVTGATGPAGNPGEPGAAGPTGIHGTDIIVLYDSGTENSHSHSKPVGEEYNDWQENLSYVITDDLAPYIWCIQGKKNYTNADGTSYTITWGQPFRLSGTNGLNGTNGSKGQIVYPAGIYDVNATYTTDANKAPYVLDTVDGNYYVLNAVMSWKGTEHDNLTPHEDYAINDGIYWLKFDGFNAIFAKIGIVLNGLIGSAVFNGDWMFSQQGINNQGNFSSSYENFNSSDPFNKSNAFRPNIAINFLSGSIYLGAGNTVFNGDGSGSIANENIKWNKSGNVITNSLRASLAIDETTSGDNIYQDITIPHISAFDSNNKYTTEVTYVFAPKTRLNLTRRIKLENPNDQVNGYNVNLTGSGVMNIEEKIPNAYGCIKFICEINGQDNIWTMVMLKDCNY